MMLPDGLTTDIIREAVSVIEKKANLVPELYEVQPSAFSSVVSSFGVYALDAVSPYKRRQPATAYPDLWFNGVGLESKASTRRFAVQSHFNHAGWYVIWRYHVRNRIAVVHRVDAVLLKQSHWKYEGSTAGEGRGGRTHTFGVIQPASVLAGKAVYFTAGSPQWFFD